MACSNINNTTIKGTSAVSYDSTPLPCTDVNTCDNLNTVLAKFDAVICNVKANVDILTEDVINITEDVMVIVEDVINIQNQLNICCPTTTTTSSSTSTSTSTTTSTTTVVAPTTTTTTTVEPTTTTTTSSSSSTSTTTSTTSSTSTTTSSSTTSTTTSTSSTTTSTTTTSVPTVGLSGTWDLDSANANVEITSINNLNGSPVSCIGTASCIFPIVSGSGQYIATPPTSDGVTPIQSPTTATLVLNLSWTSFIPGATYYFSISVTGQTPVTQFVTYGTPVVTINIAGILTGAEDVTILFTGTI